MDAVDRFRALLRIPTVSRSDPAHEDREAFARFRATLAELYPRLHERLELEVLDDGSLLYRWPGRDAGAPAVLMAHHDVVPADEPGWRQGPFEAALADDRIWGRGTLDDKGTLVAILEAVESRVTAGFEPAARAIDEGDGQLLAFVAQAFEDLGHDRDGARLRALLLVAGAVARLATPWGHVDYTLDEVLAVLSPDHAAR